MALQHVHSQDELIRFIELSGESENFDAKAPTAWDGGEESAKLTKDIMAFANSQDGGVIVVGKSETSSGTFSYDGVSADEAKSFDTTRVATWVNNHCNPPISLACHPVEYGGKLFIVITVVEFDDVPIICTKSFQPTGAKKPLLAEGTIYVRTKNAESAPLRSNDDVRALIGLATMKRGDQLLAMFGAMMKGRPLAPSSPEQDPFENEMEKVVGVTDDLLQDGWTAGSWRMSFRPGQYVEDRWQDVDQLEELVRSHRVRTLDEFPPLYQGTHAREWGICSDEGGIVWAMTRSGFFIFRNTFWENSRAFRNPWQPAGGEPYPEVPPGKWLDYRSNLFLLIQFFIFMSRMAQEFEPGVIMEYELMASPLQGRQLASADPNIMLSDPSASICRESTYRWGRRTPVETMRSDWEDECTSALKALFDLFGRRPRIARETLAGWIQRFKKRDF